MSRRLFCAVARPGGGCTRHRFAVVVTCVLVTLAVCVGYTAADLYDAVPGMFTLRSVRSRTYPTASSSIRSATITGTLSRNVPIDTAKARELIETFERSEGVGSTFSAVIADANGTVVAGHDSEAEREPASTVKTLTAFAAASTLDMGGTLDTEVYLNRADSTIVLKGHGDMLLGAGESDPNHVNGRAGLATLARSTAKALKQRDITRVALALDDTLFGQDRTPSGIEDNNDEYRYYTPISSMAVDGGRDWSGLERGDADGFTDYPILSQHTASDAAHIFAASLASQGIEVTQGGSTDDIDAKPIAKVRSAQLSDIMAFMLRHSDNTLAQLFARLTALKLGTGNSIAADSAAVTQVLHEHGVSTTGMTLTSCSGLAPGTRLRATTLLDAQSRLVSLDGGASAAAEGMSVPGLTGTAKNRIGSSDVRGLARVKTGSLQNVRSMTGNVSRERGGVVLFAIVVNDPSDGWAANEAIDRFVAALAQL